jgi:RNA polymerase sigma factor (TIGR02999 family)
MDDSSNQGEITELLSAARRGEGDAMDRLLPLVYDELRLRAHRQLRRLRPGQTLNTTALVNEAYLKLVDRSRVDWRDRTHFLAVSAMAMRQILVDEARRHASKKRGGEVRKVTLEEGRHGASGRAAEILALNQALTALAKVDERSSKMVELRFFGGLTVEETAQVLGVTDRTVKRDWRRARAYLYQVLSEQDAV